MTAHFFAKKIYFKKKCPPWFMKIHICSKLLKWTEFTLSFSTLAQWKLSHKQPFRRVLGKMCSENMQQTYRRTPMPKCDFNRAAKQLFWNHTSPANLQYIFRRAFPKNTSGGLPLLSASPILFVTIIINTKSFFVLNYCKTFIFRDCFWKMNMITLFWVVIWRYS